jgi:hypothetical protein
MSNGYLRLMKRHYPGEDDRKVYCKRCSKRKNKSNSDKCNECILKRESLKQCKKCGKDKDLECRCRQGRNHASRQKFTLSELNEFLNEYALSLARCPECQGEVIDYDYVTGDTICYGCGLVLETQPMADVPEVGDGTLIKIRKSKDYCTLVYVREKLRGLFGTDPPIWSDEWEKIVKHIRYYYGEDYHSHPRIASMGQKVFAEICREVACDKVTGELVILGESIPLSLEEEEGEKPVICYPLANKKYGERWIQARKRLGLSAPGTMDLNILANICIKIEIYELAHKTLFRNRVTKKNALNLNYVILQIIRMSDEEEFNYRKRYMKLATGKLKEYNRKWEVIVTELALNYDCYFHRELNMTLEVQWVYIPMYPADLWIPNSDKYI